MKKIPTLFERVYDGYKPVGVTQNIVKGCKNAFLNGDATIKIDGVCCAIINGELYKRYDCKKGEKPPERFISCCEPDKITGHWPGWIKCDRKKPEDKWFWYAYDMSKGISGTLEDGTYEAIGVHFNGNPYNMKIDRLERHGIRKVSVKRDFDSIKKYLKENYIEGIVFWEGGEPKCKIKRSDFGFEWNGKNYK